MAERIIIEAGTDIQLLPTEGDTKLQVRIPTGLFVRTADLLALLGANRVGFDRTAVFDEDTAGEGLVDALEAKREIVSQVGHITVTLVGGGTQLQLLLPQALRTTDDVQFRHLNGSGAAPTVAAVGAGAGPSATAGSFVITGNDMLFRVELTVAGTPTGTAPLNVVRIAFAAAFTAPPQVVMIPANRAAAALQANAATACMVPTSTVELDDFLLQSGSSTPLVDGTVYAWNFLVMGA